jgi:hypothetical protein
VSINYTDKTGKEITLMEWSELCGDPQYCQIKYTEVDDRQVSTVWLGLGAPINTNFETMIFDSYGGANVYGRSATLGESLVTNLKAIALLSKEPVDV